MNKILVVVGTRPNFIKIVQFKHYAALYGFDLKIVHTGQHYDENLSDVFFQQLGITPDYFLDTRTANPDMQLNLIKARLNHLLNNTYKPDLMVVVGDVNSTRAAAETAQILNIPIAHVESGLRSFDQSMPEEINRIVTDNLADHFFVTEQSGIDNLLEEGKKAADIYFVGNTMIDALVAYDQVIAENTIMTKLDVTERAFALVTIHRPSNVDNKSALEQNIHLLQNIAIKYPVIFPVHPRTKNKLEQFQLLSLLTSNPNIRLCEPLDYFAFQKLIASCKFIVTDSGGIQEEATFRKKPCITIRPNTE
ncbi:MAG TPA: UDP-N-acetylglucosamine 2-epimerase (non-hydrolyzing), partial [Chitinophagales bacterium]|nr:UDP-N-acetylglucosamine 2-epimerase (non-hydrolyzing) [Chitinophagales bacterium]